MKKIEKFLVSVSILVVYGAVTFFSAHMAFWGAKIGGVKEGGWNWQFMPAMFGGWVVGFLGSISCISYLLHKNKLNIKSVFLSSFGVLLLVLILSIIFHLIVAQI